MSSSGAGSCLALELYPESSHLGEEYEDHFDATRLDCTREVAVG